MPQWEVLTSWIITAHSSLYDQNTFSKTVAQTFVSLHLYGYGTVLATIQKIFTTDGRRPRSITRCYNGSGVDSMYMTTEGMEVQFCPRYEGQLNHMAESTPPPPHPVPSLVHPHDTHHYSTDGLKRTG